MKPEDLERTMVEEPIAKANQAIVASVVLAMYFPCAATFAVLIREFGAGDMLKASGVMLSSALLVGGLLNLIL